MQYDKPSWYPDIAYYDNYTDTKVQYPAGTVLTV